MSRDDGSIEGMTTVINSGSPSKRWDLVILGDGFRRAELEVYRSDVDWLVEQLLATSPFNELRTAINVHRVDVVSNESGAGHQRLGRRRSTYFDSAFGANGLDRLLITDQTLALEVATEAVREMNAVLVVVNSEEYGGSGGSVSVCSRAEDAHRIAIHEMGHYPFGLADEYAFYGDCEDPGRARYAGPEFSEPNVTVTPTPVKWASLVAPGTPMPTMPNPDPNDCNPAPSSVGEGTVGTFEGARYFRCGVYRPSFRCFMRDLKDPFCPVCAATIRQVLAPYLPKQAKRRTVRT